MCVKLVIYRSFTKMHEQQNIKIFLYLRFHSSIEVFPKHFSPLNAELNPICHLLPLLGAHHFLHISRVRVNIESHESSFQINS